MSKKINKRRMTQERHAKMICKTYKVKILKNRLTSQQIESLERTFLEAKWLYNYILNWSSADDKSIYHFNTKVKTITKKNKNFEDVPVKLKYITAQSKQSLLDRMFANIKTLHQLKKKGYQLPGKLRYKSYINSIIYKQYGMWKIINKNKIKLPGIKRPLRVAGLKQFIDKPDIEYANANLIKTGSNYYICITTFVPRDKKEVKTREIVFDADTNQKDIIGLDFGCETAITASNGKKWSADFPETERLKRLQKHLARQIKVAKKIAKDNGMSEDDWKRSKNFYKTTAKIRDEYKHISNQKDQLARDIVNYLTKKYKIIVMQNEQLQWWHANGHGKAIQHSILGRVKSLLKKSNKIKLIILDEYLPTTKLCTHCGQYHDNLKQEDRVFKCDCGHTMDRDVHAALNMIWFANFFKGQELACSRTEMELLLTSSEAPLENYHYSFAGVSSG